LDTFGVKSEVLALSAAVLIFSVLACAGVLIGHRIAFKQNWKEHQEVKYQEGELGAAHKLEEASSLAV
jgi:hypothetical protein